MTYDSLQDWIYLQNVRNEDGRIRHLQTIYAQAQQAITDKLDLYRARQQRGEFTSAFEEFRLNELNAQIDQEVARLYTRVQNEIYAGFSDNMVQTYAYQTYGIERYINLEMPGVSASYTLNFPILNTAAVDAAFSEQIAGFAIVDRLDQTRTVAQWKMREMAANIIAQGQTVTQLEKQYQALYDQIGYFRGRADAAARTEMLRAYSIGSDSARVEAEAAGVEFQFSWAATLDGKTRSSHRAMDRKKAAIVEGEPVFTLPDGSKARGPRLPARDGEGNQIGNLAADQSIGCRCRRMDLPFGIEPTARAAVTPAGDWKRVNGNVTAEEWYDEFKKSVLTQKKDKTPEPA